MSTTTLLSTITHRALSTPYALCVGTGLAASSFFFWGNVGCSTIGIFPVISSAKHRGTLRIDVEKSVELFRWWFEHAKLHFAVAGIITLLSTLGAAYFGPQSHRTYHLISASIFPFIGAWTTFIMMPCINKLLALQERIVAGKPVTEQEKKNAVEWMEEWGMLHLIRTGVGAVLWLSCLGAVYAL